MVDELKKAEAIRIVKRGNFTRKRNHLQQLLDGGAASEKLKASYAELADAYHLLEKVHEDVIVAVEDENQLVQEDKYLDEVSTLLSEMDIKVATASDALYQQKVQEEREKRVADEAAAKKRNLKRAL